MPLIFLLGFIRLPSASINFFLSCYEKNLVLSWPSLIISRLAKWRNIFSLWFVACLDYELFQCSMTNLKELTYFMLKSCFTSVLVLMDFDLMIMHFSSLWGANDLLSMKIMNQPIREDFATIGWKSSILNLNSVSSLNRDKFWLAQS